MWALSALSSSHFLGTLAWEDTPLLSQGFVIMIQYCALSQQRAHCIPMLHFRGGVTVHGSALNISLLVSSF